MNKIASHFTSATVLTAFFLTALPGFSQNEKGFSLIEQSTQLTTVSFENPEFVLQMVEVGNQQMSRIMTVEGAPTLIAGVPSLPHYSQSLVIPNEGSTNLELTYSDYYDIQNVEIAPSKGNLYRNINPSEIPYEFGTVYSQNAFYPGTLATVSDPYLLRNYRGQTIITHPFQYNPVTKTLRIYENINVSIVTNENQIGINELMTVPGRTTTFNEVYNHHFLNYSELPKPKYAVADEEGAMLLIGPASMSAGMDELTEWKNRRGIPCEWVDVASIGNTDTQIKTYIQNYYVAHPDLVFVLMIGDHAQVKAHTYGTSGWGEQLWSDSYYGQMTGDYYPELFVGRLSVTSMTDLQNVIDRQMEYEVDPMAGNHFTRAIGLGSNEGSGFGDDGEADWMHLRNIRTELLNFGMTEVHEFYDGSHGGADAAGNPNSSMIMPAVNDGVTLFNYTGHGDQNTCITGNFSSSHINSANNNGKYPFVISVACNNGSFTSGTCISESWQRAKNGNGPTGAIAATGSSILMSWAPPMETQDEMSKILTEQYVNNNKTSLGGLFYNAQMSCIDDHGSAGNEVMQTWVFFGDPAVTMRTADPMDMVVSHNTYTDLGSTQLNVNCDTDGADITVSQSGNILGTGVASGGSVLISFPGLTVNDSLIVTATKYNYRPYLGSVQLNATVGFDENELAEMKIYPNPAVDAAFVSLEFGESTDVVMTLTDLSGKIIQLISNTEMPTGQHQFEISTEGLQAGVYLISVNANDKVSIEKLTIIR